MEEMIQLYYKPFKSLIVSIQNVFYIIYNKKL